jgi:cyclophilin family peptidyl-prolyl cis-trans isomerase
VPDSSKGKRRRGSQRQPSKASTSRPPAGRTPVRGSTTSTSLPGAAWLIGGAVAVVAVIALILVFRPSDGGSAATASASPGASTATGASAGAGASASAGASSSAGASAAPGGSSAAGDCPTSQPEALPAGQIRTVTLATPKGAIAIKVEADLSPIAAGNFVALASCGFYDGTVFHRTPTLPDGTPFVIQGGDPEGTGRGGPGYTIKDEPVTTPYKRGTVAMARTSAPDSVGSQFFIVLDDRDGEVLGAANTYQIFGTVSSGMDVADAIFVASGGAELPSNPIPITAATVANP